MDLLLQRSPSTPDHTPGELFIDGVHECFTCEQPNRQIPGVPVEQWKIPGVTAIPAGRYEVILGFSQKFQRVMPHVQNVPGFEGILIHMGNRASDSEGCILVGQKLSNLGVEQSLLALSALMVKLKAAFQKETIWLEVVNPAPVPVVTT